MRSIILAALVSLIATAPSFAQLSGADWKDYCEAPEHTEMYGGCFGFLAGSLDGIRLMQKTTGTIIVCEPPNGITTVRWVEIVKQYLEQHLDQLHFAAASLVPKIVNEAFPCQSR